MNYSVYHHSLKRAMTRATARAVAIKRGFKVAQLTVLGVGIVVQPFWLYFRSPLAECAKHRGRTNTSRRIPGTPGVLA